MTKKKDPKYLGIPNICFSLTDKTDNREEAFSKQRIERGFDDSETWSLDGTIAKFIIPRLERFLEVNPCGESKEFKEDCELFLNSMKYYNNRQVPDLLKSEEYKLYKQGLEAFPRIFQGLWW